MQICIGAPISRLRKISMFPPLPGPAKKSACAYPVVHFPFVLVRF